MKEIKEMFNDEKKMLIEPLPKFDEVKQKIELLEVLKSLFELYVEVPTTYTSNLILNNKKHGKSNSSAN